MRTDPPASVYTRFLARQDGVIPRIVFYNPPVNPSTER